MLKRYKSLGFHQFPAEPIQVEGKTMCSEIHELIKLMWSKEDLPHQWSQLL
jgi:hypothetical protein